MPPVYAPKSNDLRSHLEAVSRDIATLCRVYNIYLIQGAGDMKDCRECERICCGNCIHSIVCDECERGLTLGDY